MTLQEFIDALDGYGLIVTDDDLIAERLQEFGMEPWDTFIIQPSDA